MDYLITQTEMDFLTRTLQKNTAWDQKMIDVVLPKSAEKVAKDAGYVIGETMVLVAHVLKMARPVPETVVIGEGGVGGAAGTP